MDIFLLRHAETESNRNGSLSSMAEEPLTDYGAKQAMDIVDELVTLRIQTILSSPYPRAQKTIEPFSKMSGLKVESHACLAEGQLVLDSSRKYEKPIYSGINNYPLQNETKEQFIGRAREAVELILSQEKEKILVVSHGHTIRELLNLFFKTTDKVRYPHANCGLSWVSMGEYTMDQYINRELCSNKALKRISR